MPSKLALQSEFDMNFAYSSDHRPCSPFGLMMSVSGGFLPTRAASCPCAMLSELELSPAGPLEMKMMKFRWQPLTIGLTYVVLAAEVNGLPDRLAAAEL